MKFKKYIQTENILQKRGMEYTISDLTLVPCNRVAKLIKGKKIVELGRGLVPHSMWLIDAGRHPASEEHDRSCGLLLVTILVTQNLTGVWIIFSWVVPPKSS